MCLWARRERWSRVFPNRYLPGRLLLCCLLVLAGPGCRAQSAPPNAANSAKPGSDTGDPKLDRRIEVLVRSQLQVPPDYQVVVGARSKSAFAGYEHVPITFSLPSKPDAKPVTVDFLLSEDGTTLARLQKFDLTKDPAERRAAGEPSGTRRGDRQGDDRELRRSGMPLLRAHAPGAFPADP